MLNVTCSNSLNLIQAINSRLKVSAANLLLIEAHLLKAGLFIDYCLRHYILLGILLGARASSAELSYIIYLPCFFAAEQETARQVELYSLLSGTRITIFSFEFMTKYNMSNKN